MVESVADEHGVRSQWFDEMVAKGINENLIALFKSWLRTRHATVIVSGEHSCSTLLKDMIFQGTVLGPVLWNVFYEDSRIAINKAGFIEIIYADDLNAFKTFERSTCNKDIRDEMVVCQSGLHEWGRANKVEFDSKKESMSIISHVEPEGPEFKMYGIIFDTQLRMDSTITELANATNWKLRTVLRTRRYHNHRELMLLFKAKILSFVNSGPRLSTMLAPLLLHR